MTLSNDLIQEIIEKSVLTYKSSDANDFTEEVSEEYYSSDYEEVTVKVGALEYTFIFEVSLSWRSVNSGGNGWDDEDYDYSEDEEMEVEVSDILDDEGDDFELKSVSSDSMEKIEKFLEEKLYETIK
ncbi:MAG: hypothetical protein SLAVMIC_00473 [uncultured marine phage]|uniref:Uncharacterized protein n=1 Tax=uncultured marine phage TaxID=707152 RepID=A0A8D9CD42_9VIRU|nr:MAG: hypothetical protein SLAVMIC_00473 [uncultured marine phage]